MTKTKQSTPAHIDYTSGGHYQTFNNINNIKTVDSTYAETATIDGKKQTLNRPSKLTVSNFRANIPTGGLITKITVKFKHSKTGSLNITAPTIGLVSGNTHWRNSKGEVLKKKAQAPTTTAKENTVTFTGAWDYNVVNNSNFGVEIDYPTNANDNSGTIRLYYVKVIIIYKEPNFTLNMNKGAGTYNKDTFEVTATINNVNGVRYSPKVTITLPSGLSLTNWTGNGTLTTVSARVLEWSPKLGVKVGSDDIRLELYADITYPSSVETVTVSVEAVEGLAGHSATQNLTIAKTRPADPTVDPSSDTSDDFYQDSDDSNPETFNSVTQNEEFTYTFEISDNLWNDIIEDIYNYGIEQEWWTGTLDETIDTIKNNFRFAIVGSDDDATHFSKNHRIYRYTDVPSYPWTNGAFTSLLKNIGSRTSFTLKADTIGYDECHILIRTNSESYPGYGRVLDYVWKFDIAPSTLTTPSCSILTLSQEELNRLGDGYVYRLQSYLKENTTDTYVRDWGKNFKIGVFNNAIEDNITVIHTDDEDIVIDSTDYNNLSISDIIENAEVWSQCPKSVNTYTNLECEFRYNPNYPLYILIVGDYTEATTMATITYTEPCIIESAYYNGRTTNGIYPKPIDDLVLNDGSTSEISIEPLNKSDTIVFYTLPLDDDYGTNENIAIRGIQLNGDIEQNTDNLILNASLVNAQKESKNRSIVLDQTDTTLNADNHFKIGKVGDLWGFNTQDIQQLEDWEIHLTLNNSPNEFNGHANFGNINLTLYLETVEHQSAKCYINGEDLSYYGVFLTNLKIPEGLKTDTDYINVNGTDVNDPYRQNIREKTIEVEFDIGDNCDLEGATNSLRQLTKVLVNERDQYNRPIPKRIEFSHYPDVYWEYIMEETLDNELDISSYTVKAKLVVPSGTSYDKEPTFTNTTGYVSGLASLRPNIIFKPTTDVITITETESEQEFNMSYDGDWNGKFIEIDCDNRIVWLKDSDTDEDGDNITSYVDWNSDWFTIHGEYNFETNGCAILSVQYAERW